MKQLKAIFVGMVIGVCIGLALGVNIGRDRPLLSNPFVKETLADRIKRLGGETLEQSGKVLEKTGQSLQNELRK